MIPRKTHRRRFIKGTCAAAIAGLAGCTGNGGNGGGQQTTAGMTTTAQTGPPTFTNEAGVEVGANWDAVLELAEEEGEFTIYTPNDRDQVLGFWRTFSENDAFPNVDANIVSGNTSTILPRWLNEYQADEVRADIMSTSGSSGIPLVENNTAFKFEADYLPNYAEVPDGYKTDYLAGTDAITGAMQYDTEAVDRDAITSWNDVVTDERWADGNLGWDPSPDRVFMTTMLEQIAGGLEPEGREFLENLHDQNPQWVDSHTDLTRFMAAGQYPVCFSHGDNVLDFPIEPERKVDLFDIPRFASPSGEWMNNKAPNPNAALSWINWKLSDEGQRELSAYEFTWKYPLEGYPEGLWDREETLFLSPVPENLPKIQQFEEMWNDIMGEVSAY